MLRLRFRAVLLPVAIALLLPGCGSSSSPTSATPPTTTPPAPVTTVVLQTAYVNVQPGINYYAPLSVPAAGTLTCNFGWTYATDGFRVQFASGSYPSFTGIPSTFTSGSGASGTVTATVTQAGAYAFLYDANPGNQVEAISLNCTVTSTSALVPGLNAMEQAGAVRRH